MTYFLVMNKVTVTLAEAKTNISRLVTSVERGDEVLITRHGRPVAKLVSAVEGVRRQPGDWAWSGNFDPAIFAPTEDAATAREDGL